MHVYIMYSSCMALIILVEKSESKERDLEVYVVDEVLGGWET